MAHEINELKQFIRESSTSELERRLSELKQELFNLRIQAATSALDNPKRIWLVRKQIARVKTDLGRRQREVAE